MPFANGRRLDNRPAKRIGLASQRRSRFVVSHVRQHRGHVAHPAPAVGVRTKRNHLPLDVARVVVGGQQAVRLLSVRTNEADDVLPRFGLLAQIGRVASRPTIVCQQLQLLSGDVKASGLALECQ